MGLLTAAVTLRDSENSLKKPGNLTVGLLYDEFLPRNRSFEKPRKIRPKSSIQRSSLWKMFTAVVSTPVGPRTAGLPPAHPRSRWWVAPHAVVFTPETSDAESSRSGDPCRTGAIAPVPRISAEFERSGPGTCPEFLSRGLGTLSRRRFSRGLAVSPNRLLSRMAASRAKGTERAPGGSRSLGAALILLTLPPRSLGSSGGWL